MQTQKIKNIEHIVFDNVDEFQVYFKDKRGGIPALNLDWREAKEGDWVQADDGGVVQILKRGNMTNMSDPNQKHYTGYIRTVVGTFPIYRKAKMDTELIPGRDRYSFGGTPRDVRRELEAQRTKLTGKESEWVFRVLAGHGPEDSAMEVYGVNITNARRKVKELVKKKPVMQAMVQNADEVARKLGISYEYIMQSLMNLAESSESDNVRFQALKELAEHIGLKNNGKSKVSDDRGMLAPVSPSEIDDLEMERIEAVEGVE